MITERIIHWSLSWIIEFDRKVAINPFISKPTPSSSNLIREICKEKSKSKNATIYWWCTSNVGFLNRKLYRRCSLKRYGIFNPHVCLFVTLSTQSLVVRFQLLISQLKILMGNMYYIEENQCSKEKNSLNHWIFKVRKSQDFLPPQKYS